MEQNLNYSHEETIELIEKVADHRNNLPEILSKMYDLLTKWYSKSLDNMNLEESNVDLEVDLPNLEEIISKELFKTDKSVAAKIKERMIIVREIKIKEIDPMTRIISKRD